MKLKWTSMLLLVVAVATVTVTLTRTSAQAPPAAPAYTRVAVVDVGEVFNGYARRNDLNARFEADRQKINAEDKIKEQALEQLQKVLEGLKPGAAEYEARIDQLEKLTLERRNWRQFQEQKFARMHRLLTEGLYLDILKHVEKTAKERGFDLVLYRENMDLSSPSTAELLDKIAQRKCLYANPAIDLTTAVLESLNRDHKAAANK